MAAETLAQHLPPLLLLRVLLLLASWPASGMPPHGHPPWPLTCAAEQSSALSAKCLPPACSSALHGSFGPAKQVVFPSGPVEMPGWAAVAAAAARPGDGGGVMAGLLAVACQCRDMDPLEATTLR